LADWAKGLRVTGFFLTVFAELNESEVRPVSTANQVPNCMMKRYTNEGHGKE
jgi:hypothetical protein